MTDGRSSTPARVLLACSGLEHSHRGFESFARECFDELRDEPLLELELVKASGPDGDHERAVRALKRDDPLAKALGRIWRGPMQVEQLAFAFSLQREVLRSKPEVVYFSEWYTGKALARLRRVNRQNYALVLSNGSMAPEGFDDFDRVHQHTAPALDYVLDHGADPARHILLPVAFKMPATEELPTGEQRRALRGRLDLPADATIVTSVAALNCWHKRLDYVIREIAAMPEPRPFLLLIGQPEAETAQVRALAAELLGEQGHSIRSVARDEVDLHLRASDFFVLASFFEGLPRALIEAMSHGLPCLAHEYPISQYALGDYGHLANFEQDGALAGLLAGLMAGDGDTAALASERRRSVYERFSWDALRSQYVEMLHGAVGRADFRARPMLTQQRSEPELQRQSSR